MGKLRGGGNEAVGWWSSGSGKQWSGGVVTVGSGAVEEGGSGAVVSGAVSQRESEARRQWDRGVVRHRGCGAVGK